MKNLWLFFIRYNAFFWFLLFFTVAVILAIRNNSFQRSSFVSSSNVVVGSFYDRLNSWKSYLDLSTTNEDLARENALLRQRLQKYILRDTVDSIPLADSIDESRYEFIVAEVVNNSIHQKSNYLTLSKGTKAGIEKGMGVITSNGVVGIVLHVSPNFSTVRSLLHPDSRVSVTLDSTEAFGSLVWGNNIDPKLAMLRDIPNHIKAEKGQVIRTSGFSLFPKGIKVGEVAETGIASGESFLDIRVRLSTNFYKLHHVYVVKDNLEEEKQMLEAEREDNG
ncbi:rod shape-determining protein MreC [Sphingobacterium corticibacter]|uniref:Cell shape-determining protein MreC n=1 Tax=Sphingobacterium corticibacter TaxID=2171749 RepID=A0A2T8HGT1_9SPHI|nr:rod shape-determining protein MreC [Sphingobacterium corticibacter]PVH24658.1 rod shape-determining protein MreC [Sphingobacterium corticibacter]